MRIAVKETEVFEYHELSEQAKENALDAYVENGLFWDWHETTIDDFKKALEALGFINIDIQFSGFYSQGDGLSFTASFPYLLEDWRKALESIYHDEAFLDLGAELVRLQEELLRLDYDYDPDDFSFQVVRDSVHYCHEKTVYADFHLQMNKELEKIERDVTEAIWDTCIDLYHFLRKEYEEITSPSYFAELCEINQWEFTENGDIY